MCGQRIYNFLCFTSKYKRNSWITYRRQFTSKSSLGLWSNDLSSSIKLDIEKYWQHDITNYSKKDEKKSFYVLPMFPYPSGNLHMGHVRVYSISDTIARFKRLCGYNVIHPMGWDAFGLPAENAAIERNVAPENWTVGNITSMRTQLMKLGFTFDWDRELSTCNPEYYKWTQYIFLKLFENGLAYQNKALVNWDAIDNTVLADEQVDELGCSWRSGAKVEKKIMTQWFIKTTQFAKALYDGLNEESLENWNDIINLQKHWIGECNGVVVSFQLDTNTEGKFIEVWTDKPHKLIHGQFLTLSESNIMAQEISSSYKMDSKKVLKVINPITGDTLPVHVTNYANYAEGRDTYIACPQTDDHDKKLSAMLNLNLPISEDINIEAEDKRAIEKLVNNNCGYFVSSKLRDWLISRQRYWGTPIPIIHCSSCGPVPVPYEDLPIKLPVMHTDSSNIQNLKSHDEWINCRCPKCDGLAKRETDTMDTFVDSSWYYFRFLDPKNEKIPFDKAKLANNIPVHMYIGGKEHAVLHLYYARFMSYFLHSLGWTPAPEPFKKLIVQGMVMGQSYRLKSTGKYIPPENVYKVGNDYKEKGTDEILITQWEKMSKSKYNGENPEKLLATYGCDTTRLFMLANVPPATSRHWSDETFPGILNWQNKLWMSMREFLTLRNDSSICTDIDSNYNNIVSKIWDSRNYFIATATYHLKHTQKLSVGISRLQGLTNVLRGKLPSEVIAHSAEYELALASLIIMLSPMAPHFCAELWAGLQSAPNRINPSSHLINWDKSIFEQSWPVVDDHYKLSFQCKVDGADRCELKIKAIEIASLNEKDAIEMMLRQEQVSKRINKGINRVKFQLYPGCRAMLYIFTNRNVKKAEARAEN